MSAISFVGKIAVVAALIKFSSGAVEDVFSGVMNGVAVNAAHAQMKQLHGKLMEFYSTYGRYPRTAPEMRDFLKKEFDTPVEQVLTDPWKSYYLFFRHVEILCCGPDKKPSTKDDLEIPYPENIKQSLRIK